MSRVMEWLREQTVKEWLRKHPELYDLFPDESGNSHPVTLYDFSADKYGNGGLVTLLERHAAGLLGVEATMLFPSGTMAQQVALQVWRAESGSNVVALERYSHLLRFEDGAIETLSGLDPAVVTKGTGQITADDVSAFEGRIGSLVLELPLRELGFVLPQEHELTALVDAVHERGAFVHVDGARLWESAPHFGMPLDGFIRHFGIDSAYLGLDKALGAPSGALLAGSKPFIEAARPWRHRFGGRLHDGGFVAASALMAIEEELPKIPRYVEHASTVAKALSAVDGLAVYRTDPDTPHFQVWALGESRELGEAGKRHTGQTGLRLFSSGWRDSDVPGLAVNEVTVAGPALTWSPAEIREAAEHFVAIARGKAPRGITRDLARAWESRMAPAQAHAEPSLSRGVVHSPAPVSAGDPGPVPRTFVRNVQPDSTKGPNPPSPRSPTAAAGHTASTVAVPPSPVPAPVSEGHTRYVEAVARGFGPYKPAGFGPTWKARRTSAQGAVTTASDLERGIGLNTDPGRGTF
ncbi:hypothetical protein GCM10023205_81650 [Yinghuangia aomiensis]|uniref:Aromatic amino acid beta-eliminating lyase/threonine aldolase domain-containing protein n=2 Tax=Yinghuangia aomiensis TaxID=676205 RepID=A0ABP9IEK7_9ACTN